ncbi:MAG TPA: GAP family protein [Thermoleophilia bacterium]
MGSAIGEMLPLAIGIAISPIPIIAIILMLITPKARSNGLAFLGGWLLGLAVVGTIVLIVANTAGIATSSGPSRTVSIVKLVLGLLLLFAAWRQFTKRPQPGEAAPMPKWMRALDNFTPTRSLAIGALLSGVNPKNLILNATAATGIAATGLAGVQQAVVLVVLIVVGSLGIIAPVGVYFAMGDKAAKVLDGWKDWLAANNATVMTVLFLVFGVTLIGKGIGGLS